MYGQQSWGQQAQQQWRPPQQQQAAVAPGPVAASGGQGGAQGSEVGQAQKFNISGCKHDVVGPIVRGDYTLAGSNHGKPAYKKDTQANGLVVMIYFWDERDGAASSGWWIGPQIGGNMVWGHHPNRTSGTPPLSGWQAPHSGPADPSIVLTLAGAAAQAQPQQQQQQQWGQQQQRPQQAGQQQQQWGQQPQQQQQQSQQNSWQQQQQQQQSQQQAAWQQQQQMQQHRMMQQKMMQQQQQKELEEKRAQLEEATRQRIEEQKAKIAETRRLQEEMQRKKLEEQRLKMEELRKQQLANKAATNIRRVLMKLKAAMPENFDALKEEIAKTLAEEFDNCGTMRATLQEESDKALEEAAQKVEKVKEVRAKQEEQRLEAARKKQEAQDKAKKLLVEFRGLVEQAEEALKEFQDTRSKFSERPNLDSEDKVKRAAKPVEDASAEVASKIAESQEFVKANNAELRQLPPLVKKLVRPGEEAKKEGENNEEEEEEITQGSLSKVQIRIAACRTSTDKETALFKVDLQKSLRKAAATSEMKKLQAAFAKHDKDKDGALSKKEVLAFARAEYKFALPDDSLTAIWQAMVPAGGSGVREQNFQALKSAIGVARERAKDKDRRILREAREKALADAKAKLQKDIDEVAAALKEADTAVGEVTKTARGLPVEAKAQNMKSPAMLDRATEVEAAIKDSSEKTAEMLKDCEALGQGTEVEQELKVWFEGEKRRLNGLAKAAEARCTSAMQAVERFKAEATKRDAAEVKAVAAKALAVLKKHKAEKKLAPGALFDTIEKKDSDSFDESEFAAFVSALPPAAEGEEPLSVEDLKRAFKVFDEDKVGFVSKAVFEGILQVMYKVVKDTALTENMSITDPKSIRRLEVGEVIMLLEGPVREETADVERVKGRTMESGQEGWITLAGNQGSKFLQEGVTFKVIKETILTECFEIEAPKEEARKINQSTRKLKPGELLELRIWGKKQEDTGLVRMKCKVKSDGTIGYVTSVGNTGIKFVELV